ncbi:hypothetical protein B0I22_1482 [Epilithonimonas xixisoli]|uniref:Uncharacterized protein n=1 Tax=Epilithonimonas xixisoli TaxID=1476462 RepID=A0A4R8IC47_9FLAO|nr:hypothetical protein B0I22_1482 [Epilithonimonas xixisoli]
MKKLNNSFSLPQLAGFWCMRDFLNRNKKEILENE